MYLLEEILTAFITVLSLVLCVISYLSYRRKGVQKLLQITMAFGLFFVHGVVLSLALFVSEVAEDLHLYIAILDTGILMILYLAVVRP